MQALHHVGRVEERDGAAERYQSVMYRLEQGQRRLEQGWEASGISNGWGTAVVA
jgi:hypothetical protein